MIAPHEGASPAFGRNRASAPAAMPASTPHDTAVRRLRHLALGIAWALKPERSGEVLPTLALAARHYLARRDPVALPDPADALDAPDGLAGICDELTAELALAAYRKGLFPWSHIGPQKWWAIARRSTLFFESYRIEKSVRRALRQNRFHVTFDEDFAGVIRACASPRPGRVNVTWIRPQIIDVFTELHRQGHAHSVEVRDEEGTLVGGAYGLALGRVFFTESQFFRARDASKVGFAVLNRHLQHWGFAINDGKAHTEHLGNLGFTEIARAEHNAIVGRFGAAPAPAGPWRVDRALDVAGWQPAETPGLRREAVLPGADDGAARTSRS